MLPEKFKERMMRLLGDEYADFERAMTEDEPVRGFRINGIKVTDREGVASRLSAGKIPYEECGYILKDDFPIGRSREHHAGMVYVQDPGAMAALAALDIPRGIKAIDLCAAPGGKSSKIAERIGDGGFLISNEFVPKRAKILVGNFERLGIKNAQVTSLDTAEFPKLFDGVFDLVVADVPCSGEGMFRKNAEAISEWSEENVELCQKRQKEILENAAPLVKEGGVLVYSTCTFSVEENEDNVTDFLDRHPEFELTPVKEELLPYTAPAIDKDGKHPEIKVAARRFYPHISNGEGQFVALLKRKATGDKQRGILFKEDSKPLERREAEIAERFFEEVFIKRPNGRLVKQGENVVLISHGCPVLPRSVFSAGVLVGEIRGKLLFPAHQLFSALGCEFKNKIELAVGDERLEKYLLGEEIDIEPTVKGWCAVLTDGASLGGGKASYGKLKNHYPKGLRNTR